jgi:arginyl-tRNA synthetase
VINSISTAISTGLSTAAQKVGIAVPKVKLEHPEVITHGDFSSNVALVHAKELKTNPRELAQKIVDEFKKKLPEGVIAVEIAGPGFINIKLVDSVFITEVLNIKEGYGKGNYDSGKKIMVEYTDPNPFKIFHIGHLMANSIGESFSRLIEFSGAKVVRANYYGDVGLHVAKTIWAILQNKEKYPTEKVDLVSRIHFLGEMYVLGSEKYETDESAKKDITDINKKIFEKSDKEINHYYDLGKKWSLDYFESIYKKLGTKFDYYFPESEVAELGVKTVDHFLIKGIFEKSDGAVVFPGEKYGVHTRVFINSQGLPTYEAKEVGLTRRKFELLPELSESVVITANEQSDYFKVLIKAISVMYPEIGAKMVHRSHGIMRFAEGKMSSRKGNIIPADSLLSDVEAAVDEKMKDRKFSPEEHAEVRQDVAIAALKYAILRQAVGTDIIYDKEKSVSFEGDSGPYLQYATVRAMNVLVKAKEAHIKGSGWFGKIKVFPQHTSLLEKMLTRFPEVVERARVDYAPQHVITYLTELAAAFNAYYAENLIVDEKNPESAYRVELTRAFVHVMKNGLWLLGIKVPKRM